MKEQVFLSKNYTIIESSIPFTMIFNRKDSSTSSGEDVIYMKSGWYIFDNNKLLPWEIDGVKNEPKYNCWLDYDETKIDPVKGVNFKWYTTWINPKSIESLDSDVLELEATQYKDITDKLELIISEDEERNAYLSEISADVDSLEAKVSDITEDTTSIKNDVGDMSLDVGEVVRLLGSFDNGTVLNELEQIRTVLKSPASAGDSTPWGALLSAIAHGFVGSLSELVSAKSGIYEGFFRFLEGDVRYRVFGRFSYDKLYDGSTMGSVNTCVARLSDGLVVPCDSRLNVRLEDGKYTLSGVVYFNGLSVSIGSVLGMGFHAVF